MILVAGEILFDIFEDQAHVGGAPFNFAFHLKQLGVPVRFVTRVGDDTLGRRILQLLEGHGFALEDVQVDKNHPTGRVNVALDSNGVPEFDICADAAYDHIDFESIQMGDRDEWELVYFGTLAQRTPPAFQRWQSFFNQIANAVEFFCDLNLRPPHVSRDVVSAAIRRADILKLNTDELQYLQVECRGPTGFGEMMDWLMASHGIATVSVTRGREGSTILSHGQRIDTPIAPGNPVVDTVGAGDAYAAVLAFGLVKQLPLETTAELASQFAAEICSFAGALPDNMGVYRRILDKTQGK